MLKIILNVRSSLRALAEPTRETWRNDPLSHPAITRMDLRQIADLPFAYTALVKDLKACRQLEKRPASAP